MVQTRAMVPTMVPTRGDAMRRVLLLGTVLAGGIAVIALGLVLLILL